MQLNLRAQLAFMFAVPTAVVALTGIILGWQLAAIGHAEQRVRATTDVQKTAHDVVLREYLHRFSGRGFTLTRKPKNLAAMEAAGAAMDHDFALLEAGAADVPAIAPLVAQARPISLVMNHRDELMAANVKLDRQSVLDGYLGRGTTPIARATAQIIRDNSVDSAVLDGTSDRIAAVADAARSSPPHRRRRPERTLRLRPPALDRRWSR